MGVAAEKTAQMPSAGISPFRYPGGKAWLAETLAAKLRTIAPAGGTYLEPYAGGAGAAVRLLATGAAAEIYLNDADPRVHAIWSALLTDNARFQDKLVSIEPSVTQWWEFKRIVDQPELAADTFELGFASFFLNRTNRSGILQGAAPIGGYAQSGDWKLDARFYRETLLARVRWLGEHADKIHISGLDGLKFLKKVRSQVDLSTSLFFVDPPYVSAGSRLYMNGMKTDDHKKLAKFLCSGEIKNWLLTYDDSPLVRSIYRLADVATLDVRYTLQKKRRERELLIRPLSS
jgi:DNA adenine methylase